MGALGRLFVSIFALAAILLATIACGGSSPSEPTAEGAVFLILSSAAAGETFHVLIQEPSVIAEAKSLAGRGNVKIINGRLARGDGGFNQPWSWHMIPDSVGFADGTIEVCDGRPSFIEEDLDYWIDTLGQFCPWGTEVLRRVR